MRIRGDAAVSHGDAARFDSRVWRDPRLLLGILLVLASTVVGGLALAAADHTESYWSTSGSVRLGESVSRADFVAVRAKVPKRTARSLLRTDEPLPNRVDQLSWAATTRAGTLITRDMLASRQETVELPVAVAAGNVPNDLRAGDRVDVWAAVAPRSEESTSQTAGTAQRVLRRVRVLSSSAAAGVGGGPGLTVVVDVAGLALSGQIVGAASSGRVTVVRVS